MSTYAAALKPEKRRCRQTMVEFALVASVFLLLIFTVMQVA